MPQETIRIGVVSDTHMFSRGRKLPDELVAGLAGVDLILHAGDFTDPAVIPLLESIAPLEAVAGNNDGMEIVRRFGYRRIVTAGGKRIGVVHGHQGPGRSTEAKASLAFRDEPVDIIVFGHSHAPHYERTPDGVLLFNPGSPTDKRWQAQYSYGLIEIGDRVEAVHRFYDDKK